jgi:hypothetical protein
MRAMRVHQLIPKRNHYAQVPNSRTLHNISNVLVSAGERDDEVQEVLDFKPAPRLEQVDDKRSKQMEDRKHRRGRCADSASPRESVRMRFLGKTRVTGAAIVR